MVSCGQACYPNSINEVEKRGHRYDSWGRPSQQSPRRRTRTVDRAKRPESYRPNRERVRRGESESGAALHSGVAPGDDFLDGV